jgi:prepilin-type N-terminal cleavage/methylation domain-containing protein
MKRRSKKRGFSLAEILVAVAIMAVVAAVVIPSIGGQLNKGDVARVSGDLTSVQGAIEQFLADVRRYPLSMSHLQTKVVIANSGLTGGVYSASQAARWRGPYMTKDFSVSGISGFGSSMVSLFAICDNTAGTTGTCAAGATQQYLTIRIPGLTTLEAAQIDSVMDDGNLTTGMIQFKLGASVDKDTLWFLALPIQ